MRSERFDKKVSFQEFTDKVANYVVSNFKDGGDIQPFFVNLRRNLEKSYGLIWGQCSAGSQAHIKGTLAYAAMSPIFNVVLLLHELKKATSGIDDKAQCVCEYARCNVHYL